MIQGLIEPEGITVKPPIMDSPRYGFASLQRTNNVPLIVFAIDNYYNTFSTSERQTTSYLRTTDRKHAPKGQVAIQNSLQERTEIEASGGM